MTIPFVWKLQPYEDPEHWCTCVRCQKALSALRWHVRSRDCRHTVKVSADGLHFYCADCYVPMYLVGKL